MSQLSKEENLSESFDFKIHMALLLLAAMFYIIIIWSTMREAKNLGSLGSVWKLEPHAGRTHIDLSLALDILAL